MPPRIRRTVETGYDVQHDEHEDALDGSGEDAEVEAAGVEFLPGGEVEVCEGAGLGGDGPPGAAEVERALAQYQLELEMVLNNSAKTNRTRCSQSCL